MSDQEDGKAIARLRPIVNDRRSWHVYWSHQGKVWRWEPEIDEKRQKYLDDCLNNDRHSLDPMLPDFNSPPFKDIRLSRADIEWLLAEVESKLGPHERGMVRGGYTLDLRAVDLRSVGLSYLPLERITLSGAHLEGADLSNARLAGTDLCEVFFDAATKLNSIVLVNGEYGAASLADIHWGGVNLAVVDWLKISMLGDELKLVGYKTYDVSNRPYQTEERAYRQLAVVLRNQGLNESATRFAYRAQLMERRKFWFQRKYGPYLFSLSLALISGYGYKPLRSFITYLLVIGVFAAIYFNFGSHLTWNEAIVISMTAFHGRGFFPEQFKPGDPQALAAALEAFVGLLIEVTFIATLTQRLFGK